MWKLQYERGGWDYGNEDYEFVICRPDIDARQFFTEPLVVAVLVAAGVLILGGVLSVLQLGPSLLRLALLVVPAGVLVGIAGVALFLLAFLSSCWKPALPKWRAESCFASAIWLPLAVEAHLWHVEALRQTAEQVWRWREALKRERKRHEPCFADAYQGEPPFVQPLEALSRHLSAEARRKFLASVARWRSGRNGQGRGG
jgi:hypothetical protein